MSQDTTPSSDLIGLTADVVAAFVANNTLAAADLPGLIAAAHAAFAGLGTIDDAIFEPAPVAAVSARKSLANRDRILSMIDGQPYASLKRHLRAHGLTSDEYRSRYRLPADYPMIAPGYSEMRRDMAKAIGLGRKTTATKPVKPTKPAKRPVKRPRP
ncbi:MucR family transcriptional regulator [Hephaestia sp. GCM10023244]|uniref:MucR family transcriptional regulator n=1 Tax=unclassified Hephaestia TaxID=2631281 RepID=UPI0020773CD3|nr:MucR family transcriptional regulator [Hephaestia sp. MAHUQ-44]MCM8731985.1 MucR family transcriptional regulator [Hephaestia sp. MAHUQ-44]